MIIRSETSIIMVHYYERWNEIYLELSYLVIDYSNKENEMKTEEPETLSMRASASRLSENAITNIFK